MSQENLTLNEARRIALTSQGFDRPRPSGKVNASHIRGAIRRLGLVQIDYVNVLTPAHYQVLFSRLGSYKKSLFDDLVYRRREFTEQWAHEASILPMESWPLLRHRMEAHRVRPWGFESFIKERADYVERVFEEVSSRGPLGADDLPAPDGMSRRLPGAWVGTVPRAVLEALFGRGVLAVAERRPNFSRTYDLAERVIPAEHHGRKVEREEGQRELLRLAARSHGVGTAGDLADYYRMPIRDARLRIAELVEAEELREARVEGWREPAYLHPEARMAERIEASALLSPFDPVVWHRQRAARLFGFDYRIEIYTPAEKRRWGYYVLPFLFGERLVARVDLKADRAARRLLTLAAYIEAGADPGAVAEALATELWTMAAWLELDSVFVERRGGFARTLAAAVRAHEDRG
ncbi:MAG TPA: crosslink repair DNA glycosylase YcaQ family protein [Blastocatellia bacterium]|nr:crosslink repair DNA glycosylase YcaQ family protein [Blastocatellia bacterium]